MPEINIEEKIQEALKRRTFKDNKLEYLGLALIYCVMLFMTFVVGYFVPFIAILLFFVVDIPLMMGFKHFIWFGPASGETLIEGFKVSMLCGYLNYISYLKIFITSNIRALIWGGATLVGVSSIGSVALDFIYTKEINDIVNQYSSSYDELINALMGHEDIMNAMTIVSIIAIVASIIVFYFIKLNRSLLPYVSFLRLTNLEGKSMEGVISHTKRVLQTKRWAYYMKATLYHLLYLIPIGLSVLVFYVMSSNPVYSPVTLDLISTLTFFVTMFPAVLFVELNNRNFCIEANQDFLKEHKKMLNDAMNDLNKNSKR